VKYELLYEGMVGRGGREDLGLFFVNFVLYLGSIHMRAI